MESQILGAGMQATSVLLGGRNLADWLALFGPILIFLGIVVEIIDRRRTKKGAVDTTSKFGYVALAITLAGAAMLVGALEL